MAVRLSLEVLYCTLVGGGAVVAVGADKLSMAGVRDAAVVAVFLGIVVFGLDMIVKRRGEISTRYSSTVNPSFHVFRGWSAVWWGIAFALLAGMLGGYAAIEMVEWTAAKDFFRARPGILIILTGLMVIAWGLGSAGRATYRYRQTETPAERLADRVTGFLAIPAGFCILGAGILRTFAPSVLEGDEAFINRLAGRPYSEVNRG